MPGDLLICEGGYPGRCAIWDHPEREMYFQKALHRVRPKAGIAAELIAISLEVDSKSGDLEAYFTGATIKHFVGQALDLTADRIVQIYAAYSGGGNLQDDFQKRFGVPLDEESLNASHQIIIVASELDSSTERIVAYLNARDIAINVLFFKVFEHAGQP